MGSADLRFTIIYVKEREGTEFMYFAIITTLISILFGVACYHLAKRLGLNPVKYGVLGVCFWFFTLIFLLVKKYSVKNT